MRQSIESRCSGMALLAVLLMLILMGIALAHAATWWSVERQRDDETQLLWAGDQYRLAIQRYYYASPSGAKTYPKRLEYLLDDPRYPLPVHHLRRLYPDPMTDGPFQAITVGDQIIGVASTSKKTPIKRRNFPAPYGFFQDQEIYAKWEFSFLPPGSRMAISNAVPSNQQPIGDMP